MLACGILQSPSLYLCGREGPLTPTEYLIKTTKQAIVIFLVDAGVTLGVEECGRVFVYNCHVWLPYWFYIVLLKSMYVLSKIYWPIEMQKKCQWHESIIWTTGISRFPETYQKKLVNVQCDFTGRNAPAILPYTHHVTSSKSTPNVFQRQHDEEVNCISLELWRVQYLSLSNPQHRITDVALPLTGWLMTMTIEVKNATKA